MQVYGVAYQVYKLHALKWKKIIYSLCWSGNAV